MFWYLSITVLTFAFVIQFSTGDIDYKWSDDEDEIYDLKVEIDERDLNDLDDLEDNSNELDRDQDDFSGPRQDGQVRRCSRLNLSLISILFRLKILMIREKMISITRILLQDMIRR